MAARSRSEVARANLVRLGLLKWAERTARREGVTLAELLSKSRVVEAARARRVVWSLMHGTLGLGVSELGRVFCVHHSTVVHALRVRERELLQKSA